MNEKPVVLVVMDGVGLSDKHEGNAVYNAYTPNLDNFFNTCPWTAIKAHGTAVGLPSDDDMGNSEVGHNAIGCGQVYSQGAKLVNESIETGKIFESDTWKDILSTSLVFYLTVMFTQILSILSLCLKSLRKRVLVK